MLRVLNIEKESELLKQWLTMLEGCCLSSGCVEGWLCTRVVV